jgi:signal transduction histidine kinase
LRAETITIDRTEVDRCFFAYAAHELRGEITLQLALAEVALADPDPAPVALRKLGEQVAAACGRQERLLEALLTLARSEHGRLRREPVDLAATAAQLLHTHAHPGLERTTTLEPARTAGDPLLIERLLANLIENAIHHNIPGGRVDVDTHTAAGRASVAIANTGPVIPTGELSRLFEPFQRLNPHPRACADGLGLGLAIVQAIADAHHATITARPQIGGGLRIKIGFPAERQ